MSLTITNKWAYDFRKHLFYYFIGDKGENSPMVLLGVWNPNFWGNLHLKGGKYRYLDCFGYRTVLKITEHAFWRPESVLIFLGPRFGSYHDGHLNRPAPNNVLNEPMNTMWIFLRTSKPKLFARMSKFALLCFFYEMDGARTRKTFQGWSQGGWGDECFHVFFIYKYYIINKYCTHIYKHRETF